MLVSAAEKFRVERSLLDWAGREKDDFIEKVKNGAGL